MVNFYSKLINYPLSSYSCTSSYFDVARWLWALPECQAGETFDVACPTTCIAEEFKRKNKKEQHEQNDKKVTKRINSRICMRNAPTDRLVKPWKRRTGCWLAGCWCFAGPCLAVLPLTPPLACRDSRLRMHRRSGLSVVNDTGQSNDPFAAQWWWKSIHRQAGPG